MNQLLTQMIHDISTSSALIAHNVATSSAAIAVETSKHTGVFVSFFDIGSFFKNLFHF